MCREFGLDTLTRARIRGYPPDAAHPAQTRRSSIVPRRFGLLKRRNPSKHATGFAAAAPLADASEAPGFEGLGKAFDAAGMFACGVCQLLHDPNSAVDGPMLSASGRRPHRSRRRESLRLRDRLRSLQGCIGRPQPLGLPSQTSLDEPGEYTWLFVFEFLGEIGIAFFRWNCHCKRDQVKTAMAVTSQPRRLARPKPSE
jgi:hypothetical protein